MADQQCEPDWYKVASEKVGDANEGWTGNEGEEWVRLPELPATH